MDSEALLRMAERVAARVHEARFASPRRPQQPTPFEDERPDGQEYCRRLAQAAILEFLRAIREPTPEMVEAGARQIVLCGDDWTESRSRWDDMPEYGRDHYRDQARVGLAGMIDTLLASLSKGTPE